jgi:hypothetical protein
VLETNEALVDAVPIKAPDWTPKLLSDGAAYFIERLSARALSEPVTKEEIAMAFKTRSAPKQEPKPSGKQAA